MHKMIKKGLIFGIFLLMGNFANAQRKAAIHFNDGSQQHLFIRQQLLQEDEHLYTSETLKDRKKKISLNDVKYIALYPHGNETDSTYVMPVNVYINPKKSVKRWLANYYMSPNISVFYGFFAKGLKRNESAVYYYENSGMYPMHYLYLKRPTESGASVWWSQDISFDQEISLKDKVKFLERTAQYFSDAPKLQKMLENAQFSSKNWKDIILQYEIERKENSKKSNQNNL